MKLCFQADADLNPEIGRGLRRREPSIDFSPAAGTLPDGMSDLEVLQLAALNGRVLVTRDISTMPMHFEQFVLSQASPGVILIPSRRSLERFHKKHR